jgi:hypothetical protein
MRRSSLWSCSLVILHLLAARGVTAQSVPTAAELQAAAAAFAASDWKAAHTAYADIARRFPTHALARFRTGVTLTELGHPDQAETMLREGEKLGFPAPQAAWRLAESLAEQHKPDAAIAELRRSAAAGNFVPLPVLDGNAHFRSLHAHPLWASVRDAFDAIVQPCRHDPRFREFDFWVGDWDVRPTGTTTGPASRNRVTLEENGCVVQEHWDGQGGSTGQSFNLYDRSIGKWRQTWVDNIGGQHDYVGALDANGHMVLEGTTPAPNGARGRIPTRLTLFHLHADTVRQFFQLSNDSGRTWVPSADLTYVRRKP